MAALKLHTTFQSNEALLLKDFRSPTSLSRRLSITRRHKGNFYKLQRGPLYNKKQSLSEIFIVILQKSIIILCIYSFVQQEKMLWILLCYKYSKTHRKPQRFHCFFRLFGFFFIGVHTLPLCEPVIHTAICFCKLVLNTIVSYIY